jgi:hypothetical protein
VSSRKRPGQHPREIGRDGTYPALRDVALGGNGGGELPGLRIEPVARYPRHPGVGNGHRARRAPVREEQRLTPGVGIGPQAG